MTTFSAMLRSREERRLLVDHRDAGVAGVVRRVEVDRLAVDAHLPAVAPDDAAQHLDQRRLAGAVLAHQRADLAGAQSRGRRRAARARRRRTSPRRDNSTSGPPTAARHSLVDHPGLSSRFDRKESQQIAMSVSSATFRAERWGPRPGRLQREQCFRQQPVPPNEEKQSQSHRRTRGRPARSSPRPAGARSPRRCAANGSVAVAEVRGALRRVPDDGAPRPRRARAPGRGAPHPRRRGPADDLRARGLLRAPAERRRRRPRSGSPHAAVALLVPRETVFLDSSTTSYFVARADDRDAACRPRCSRTACR